jgi:hypothetical protein
MLSKCTNPACSTTFRYLSEGKLYLIDSKAVLVRHGARAELKYAGKSCSYEYFWLCSSCCRDMTIQIDNKFEVSVVRLPGIRQGSEADQAQRETLALLDVARANSVTASTHDTSNPSSGDSPNPSH